MSKYNGWSNYETWAVYLWIENEEATYHHWRAVAHEVRGEHKKKRDQVIALALLVKDTFEEAQPEVEGVWADLLSGALSEVSWQEIAESLLTP